MDQAADKRLVSKDMAVDGDLMVALVDGDHNARPIVKFLYSHKDFRRMARWLMEHGFTGTKLVEYFEDGHNLSVLKLIKEIKRYELGMYGDIFASEFNDDPADKVKSLLGSSSQE